MIQPLRTAHRWIFIALAVVLTVVLIAAIRAQRAPIPNNPSHTGVGGRP
jgi:hypothetical protein